MYNFQFENGRWARPYLSGGAGAQLAGDVGGQHGTQALPDDGVLCEHPSPTF